MEGPVEKRREPVFTDEEIQLIRLWSLSDLSAGRQVCAQVAYFATPALFGVYGLAAGSQTILGVAFICILLLLVWSFVSTWREQRQVALMQSICKKLLAGEAAGHDERGEPAA